MTKQALEIVEFELNEGVSTEAFLSEIEVINSFVTSLDGYIARHTARNEKGVWVDVVIWRDLPAALAATKAFETSEDVIPFAQMINHSTIRMKHYEVEKTL